MNCKSVAITLIIAGCTLPMPLATSAPAFDAWPETTPAEAGFAPDVGDRLDAAVIAGKLDGLHGLVVARDGKLVLERYYVGADERWGRQLGRVTFGAEVVHDLRSVSKSVVGLLYGIAHNDGIVPDLNAPLVDQFPDLGDLASDPARRRLTVAHALTMQLGLEWNEDLPYSDPRNSEIAMEMADDRYRYVLSRPIVAAPGKEWRYTGGATALIAHLIARGSGTTLMDYAREKLLGPLGITDAEWIIGMNGREEAAASGLRMRPRDLAKIGQLVLNRGRWGDQQLVPADWLDQSFTQHANFDDEVVVGYGYQWWLGRHVHGGKPWYGAFGNGGQRLFIAPSLDIVIAVTAGNYNQPDAWRVPVAVQITVLSALKPK